MEVDLLNGRKDSTTRHQEDLDRALSDSATCAKAGPRGGTISAEMAAQYCEAFAFWLSLVVSSDRVHLVCGAGTLSFFSVLA